MALPGARARAQEARVAGSDIRVAEAEMGFCRDTWVHNGGYFASLPHLAIKAGDASELSAALPGEEMGSQCQREIISWRPTKSRLQLLRVGALRGGFKAAHDTWHPGRGFKDPAEMRIEQLSRNTSLGESQLLSLI